MYPFSSYIFQQIFHEQMLQEAMEQAHIDSQLSNSRSRLGTIQYVFRLLTRSLPLKWQQHASIVSTTPMQNSYSHNQHDCYPGCDSGTAG